MTERLPTRRSSGRVTLQHVADAAGVSPITVSRALRGERAVAPALAERARAAAAALGYVPDPAARALASHRSTQVAVLIPLLSNMLFVDLLDAVQRTLRPAGYQTLIGITHYDPHEEEQLLREQLAHRPAGLLVTGFERSEETRALIAGSGVPCVHLMETSRAPGVHCVGFSQHAAGRAMTEHLIARGARRIAFAAAQLDERTLQRAEGYRSALRDAGCYDPALEWLRPEPSSIALGASMFERIMAADAPDAVFFCNDDLAQGALLAALRLGIQVPRQVAVAGFNDLPGSDQMLPTLTSVATPRAEVGVAAARMLLALMRGEPVAAASVALPWHLALRESA
ncbi:LacI family DNA-binding transcriptional regulator [Variovorax ginsengisoli]|uniref:LacI family gluconate utilization system Gnt-I transcriptional repressor n=1 Tax=Variovorax ginsengisoli TaxID=363844 RepID=A0ABT9S639_9BURK|nr:LacI family DNA-binding transcriptional regulator [Variovorax ginsengisoli]MDP9899359.1 LacI family gluconate utilization system Gnt-I transcriptional repressor [Variovorax ginsengisoli]